MAAEEAGTKDKVSRLFEYFRSVWYGLYSPEQWSVYKDGQGTNNGVESFNRQFHDRCCGTTNSFWDFISK